MKKKIRRQKVKDAMGTDFKKAQPKCITQFPEFSEKCRLDSTFIFF
jgi:hypothetical protein